MQNFKEFKGAIGKKLYKKPNCHLDFWYPTNPKYWRESILIKWDPQLLEDPEAGTDCPSERIKKLHISEKTNSTEA